MMLSVELADNSFTTTQILDFGITVYVAGNVILHSISLYQEVLILLLCPATVREVFEE